MLSQPRKIEVGFNLNILYVISLLMSSLSGMFEPEVVMDKLDEDNKAKNSTKVKLAGLPFRTVAEKNSEENDLQKETWRQLTRAKNFYELSQRDEFSFLTKIFERGIRCHTDQGGEILHIYLKDNEIGVVINPDQSNGSIKGATELSSLIQGLSDTFIKNYLDMLGLLGRAAGKTSHKLDAPDIIGDK
jgi:hypothetical protein